jgi:LysR family transcriptional regulator, hypochlorite-specific transcription factor HypT
VPWLSYSADAQLGRIAALAIDTAEPPLTVHPVFESALVEALRATALEGLGVAWLPGSLIADDLNHKRLVRAGPASLDVPLRVRVFAERSLLSGRLQGLWDSARQRAEDSPGPVAATDL